MEDKEMEKPILKQENVATILDKKFLKCYDFSYFPSSHYYVTSRHEKNNLVALKSKEAFSKMMPDAVSCVVILKCPGKEPLLCLTKEMRYPTGQFLLGVPAGLLDPEDLLEENAVFAAAKRELWEETGISWEEKDEIKMINPLLFSSPGITDESNAMVQMTLHREKMPNLTSDGAVGGERFEGFVFLNKEEACKVLKNGMDADGLYYSVFTWIALTCFVTGMWE